MPRIDQYPDATIPSLAADSLTAGKVEGIAVPGLAGHPYMLQGLGNRPGEPGVGKQARGVGMLRPPLRAFWLKMLRCCNTWGLSQGRFRAGSGFSCDQGHPYATRHTECRADRHADCGAEEQKTNATGRTFGGHSRRDGGPRMQWVLADADERAVKL